jgi:hypothetical protein
MKYPDQEFPSPTSKISRPSFVSAIEEFDPVIKRLSALSNRLDAISGRLDDRPREVLNDEKSSGGPPSPLLQALHFKRTILVDICNNIERTLQTIEEII